MASSPKIERKLLKKLPFQIEDFSHKESRRSTVFKEVTLVGPKKYFMTDKYKKFALDIYNFEARPDDVFLVGCVRTGTTVTSELVWLIENGLDFERAAEDILDYRVPHIDFEVMGTLEGFDAIRKARKEDDKITEILGKYRELTLKDLSERKCGRILKPHLPLNLMSPHIFEIGARVIYCSRNPKDMLVSLYNLNNNFIGGNFDKDFHAYVENFKADLGLGWPYIEHTKEAWDKRNDKNVLFLFYEDTIKDMRGTILKIAEFLGKKLSEDEVNKLEDHVKIENFRNNKSVNWDHIVQVGLFENSDKIIRKGKPGGWRELFDEELEKEFDQIVEEKLKGSDLKFPNIG